MPFKRCDACGRRTTASNDLGLCHTCYNEEMFYLEELKERENENRLNQDDDDDEATFAQMVPTHGG